MANQETALANILKEHEKEIRLAAPKHLNIERLMGLAIAARKNPALARCSPASVVEFCMKMAQAGTDRIGAGGMWAVPYKGEMAAIPDWRLLIEKARQAKVIKHCSAEAVHEGDVFSYERGLNPNLIHKPVMTKKGALIAVYCIYTLPDGEKDFVLMTKEEIDDIRKRSKAGSAGPWVTDFEEMAKKTVIKRALKIFEGASPELAQLMDDDNRVFGFDGLQIQEPISEPQAIKKNKVVDVEPEPQKKPAIKETPEEPTPTEEPGNEAPTQQEEEPAQSADPFKTVCEECPKEITSRVADFSKRKYGKKLCMDCQDKREKK